MHDDQLNQLVSRHAVFTSTCSIRATTTRAGAANWAEVNRLVDEINRLIRLRQRPSA
jgi:hypothetical protein